MSMNDQELIEEFAKARNIKARTLLGYKHVFNTYKEYTGKQLTELLKEAEKEEEQGIRWKHRTIKKRLIGYRNYLQDKYCVSTVKLNFSRLLTFYRHHEIEIHDLPSFNTKNARESTPLNFKDLPDKDIIKHALKIATPIMRAIILFISSSGCARRETLNLTIGDFIEATKDYHNSNNIYEVIDLLKDEHDVIPTFTLKRQKTGNHYITFCSPEATSEIINYLLSINKPLKNEEGLFKINLYYFNREFSRLNDLLKLGKRGNYNRFRSHMLRKFHASQLYNDGMSLEDVDSLQGRGKDSTHSSYFMDDPEKLREKYIEHLNAVTINLDVNNLDLKSSEYIKLETENKELSSYVDEQSRKIDEILERVYSLEKMKR